MSSRLMMGIASAGVLALAAAPFAATPSLAQDRAAVTTEFSAQSEKEQKQQNQQQKVQQRQDSHQQRQQGQQQKQQFEQQKQQQKVQQRQDIHQQRQQGQQQKQQFEQQKQQQKVQQREQIHQQKDIRRDVRQQGERQKQFQKQQTRNAIHQQKDLRREFKGGPNAKVVTGAKIRGLSNGNARFALRGRNYSYWHGRGGYRWRDHNGRWRTFVALGALGVLAIGAATYYPYAYIDAPQDYCDGLTEDGCQLDYQDVETVEGDVIGQCVAYCPWQ
jgi:hypothetical protein